MIEALFSQYSSYSNFNIALELTGVLFGLLSVWFAKKDNILVFPTGLVSTSIYAYLLWQWELLGDSMINGYYFIINPASNEIYIEALDLFEEAQSLAQAL